MSRPNQTRLAELASNPGWPCAALLVLVIGSILGLPALAAGGQQAAGDIARRTVAEAMGIDFSRTRVVTSEARDFPDASLDCPQPRMAYAQVITPGFQVLVEADGRRFDVRVAGSAGRICHRRKRASGSAAAGSADASPAAGIR